MANRRISKYHWVDTFLHSKLQPGKKALAAFQSHFPQVNDAEWTFNDQHLYEVLFYLDGQSTKVMISPSGKLKEICKSVPIAALPKSILDEVHETYGQFYPVGINLIDKEGHSSYEITIDTTDRSRLFLLVATSGQIIHEEPLFTINAEGIQ